MVQKKKSSKSTSVKRKSTSASPRKRKLGDSSLDWITNTTEGETILPEQAENRQIKSDGVSKKTKIGVFKQYVSEEAEKKKDETLETTPAILGSSSTITKGKRVMPAKEEEAQKSVEEDKEKTISKEKTPVEIGKTYKITEEKELVLAEEEEETVSDKKEAVPDDKKILLEYEVKKEDVTAEAETKIKESTVYIPEDSSSIVKKKVVAASEKEKTVTPAAKEETPAPTKRKRMRISGIGESLKKGSKKVSGTVIKPFKFDKTKFKKSLNATINVSKHPVKAISAVDRKITQSMKKVVMFSEPEIAEKTILKNIKSTDTQITKSAKKLIDSILNYSLLEV